ncbi:hypothetical protein GGU10DRAFT_359248 [Lentinula aff. detonsa]|uniref:Secreted protein n=1 Tax=Lentinula aff. detonsa TaxID=2804958 RepID=A0AA38KR38_9AGAR|nr:hypothetical protein GGU10DRAFT_359248 [Lentinula aff. detonsa]
MASLGSMIAVGSCPAVVLHSICLLTVTPTTHAYPPFSTSYCFRDVRGSERFAKYKTRPLLFVYTLPCDFSPPQFLQFPSGQLTATGCQSLFPLQKTICSDLCATRKIDRNLVLCSWD